MRSDRFKTASKPLQNRFKTASKPLQNRPRSSLLFIYEFHFLYSSAAGIIDIVMMNNAFECFLSPLLANTTNKMTELLPEIKRLSYL
jgi:hypothetical protein